MKLYELSEYMLQVNQMLEEGAEGLEDTLESIEASFEEKVNSIVRLMKSKVAHAAAIDEEVKRLCAMKKKLESSAEHLHSYVETEMKKLGLEKVNSTLFDIKLKTNPKRVNVVDETIIPKEFITTKITNQVDKIAIKEAIALGQAVPGVEIVQDIKLSVK